MATKESHPFLDPLWRRVVLIAACAIWTAVEAWHGNTFWFIMVGIVTVYGAMNYLYNYVPSDRERPPEA